MESNNKSKLKYIAVASGILTLGIAGVISAAVLAQQNTNEQKTLKIKQQVYSNVVPISDQSVNFEIFNLGNTIGEKFYIKYWDANFPNPSPQIAVIKKRENETTLKFNLGNLNRRIIYNYQILDKNYNPISSNGTFNTFNVPKINFIAQKNSISFSSETLNNEYYKNKIHLKYWEYIENDQAPKKTEWIPVIAEKNELDDSKQSYQFKGLIENLKENTPYVIQLSLNGKEGDIDFQAIVYTLGLDSLASLRLLNVSNTTANINLGNLASFIKMAEATNSINFYLKYWKNNQPEIIQKSTVIFSNQNSMTHQLTDLENGTTYQATLAFEKDGIETIISSPINFTTGLIPYPVDFENKEITHKVIFSNHNGAVKFSGFAANGNAIDLSKMQLMVSTDLGSQQKINLGSLSQGISNNVFPIRNNLQYNINIVDTATASVKFLPENMQFEAVVFKADFKLTEQNDNQLVYEINDLPTFYKPEEMKLSLKPIGESTEILEADLENFDATNNKATATIKNLAAGTSYYVRLLPKYTELNSDQDDLSKYSLTNETFKYLAPGNVTFVGVEGNFLTDSSLKFKLTNLGQDFPKNENLRLQWRIKPTKDETEWKTPDDTNSILINLSEIPTSNSYDAILNLANNDKINLAVNEINQVRLIKTDDTTNDDLIKAGVKEFNLNTNVTAAIFNKQYIPFSKIHSLTWQKPEVANVVGSGLNGTNYGVVMERHFDGLKTQKQWQDFYGYLAFKGSEAEVNNFIDHVTVAAQGYKTDDTTNDYTNRNYVLPVTPGEAQLTNYTSPASDGTEDQKSTSIDNYFKANDYNILLGSYAYDADFSVLPYNPSSFLSMIVYNYSDWNVRQGIRAGNNKFQNWDSFPFTIYYKLSKYKQIGLAKDNLYLKNSFLTKTINQVPAYTFNNEQWTKDFLDLTTDQENWNLALITKNNDDTDAAVYVNDEKGSVYAKVQFQNKDNQYLSYYGWVKLDGFKQVDRTTPPTKSDWNLESFPEAIIGPYYLTKVFNDATDESSKKAVIEKYFKIISDENIDFTPLSMEVDSTDNTKITLKVKLIKKGLNNTEIYQVESEELEYKLTLNKLNSLPALNLLKQDLVVTKNLNETEKLAWKLTNNSGILFDINHSMAELFYKVQEAKAKDKANGDDGVAVTALKNEFKSSIDATTGFRDLENKNFVYLRAKGEKLVSKKYADLDAYQIIIPEEKIGFFLKVEDSNALDSDEDKLKLIDYLVEHIDEMF
ncbi:hypothetical protein ACW95P_01595 [Candidatus Mycoplasma pogonae]